MPSTSALTSSKSFFRSQPFMTSMTTVPDPSLAVESIRFIPASPATLSSIRCMIASSTSAGEAPMYSVVTVILSKENSGKTSIFMVRPVTAPANMRNSISRLAAT